MPATIVIPAYQAVEDLARCLESLERTLPAGTRVLVADDASPDPAVPVLIANCAASSRLAFRSVRREKNLGFIGNVNRAFAETTPDDVILFNADAWATPGWYEAMLVCAASDARIATVTPWSNNAEICSLPEFCRAGPVPSPDEAERVARIVREAGRPVYPDLPTGVGFCMFVRRAALEALGDFDAATFGRGYGEENDFCQRAIGHGWRNVLCDAAYVVHRGGASFGPEGHVPGGENLARLVARYPHYNAQVADFILRDPLASLRERIVALLANAPPQSPARVAHVQEELFPPA